MRILYVEPYHTGSHAAFTRTLSSGIDADWTLLTMPGRHWKWRFRGAAPYLALEHRDVLEGDYDLLMASSYAPLAELRGLVPKLASHPSVLYFHENQLAYPMRAAYAKERDVHFGFSQMIATLVADRVVFNSAYNHDSFLEAASSVLEKMPDCVPKGWVETIRARAQVLPLPLSLPPVPASALAEPDGQDRSAGPTILWNHRWEHDKNPEVFFAALRVLVQREVPFRVIACGIQARQAPPVFEHAREWLGDRVLHWGFAASEEDYWQLLTRAHVAVSTADQEFFGISMMEATHCGAFPLVPDRLSYTELFPASHRYAGNAALFDRLEALCRAWVAGGELRKDRRAITSPYAADRMLPVYAKLFAELVRGR